MKTFNWYGTEKSETLGGDSQAQLTHLLPLSPTLDIFPTLFTETGSENSISSSPVPSELHMEIRYGTRRRSRPSLIRYQECQDLMGASFRSVYLYPEAVKNQIEEQGDTKNLTHLPIVSDILFLDVDSSQEDAETTWRWIQAQGWSAEHWHTGRRGGHFHIPIKPMQGSQVPASQKAWVEANVPVACDLTIYKHTGQFRLPGAVHEKQPGEVKRLLARQEGTLLEIPLLPAPPPIPHLTVAEDSDSREEWVRALQTHRTAGGRSQHMYILACCARDAGVDETKVIEGALLWNQLFCEPPHSEEYVVSKMRANLAQVLRSPRGQDRQVPRKA